jgi:two-component system, OmpR family, sensor kinase
MSLRTGLVLALAYVLLLVLLALGIPLALNVRDRVDAEVRVQSQSQADVVAATASGLLNNDRGALGRLARTSARSVRGRVVVVDRRGRVLADSSGPGSLGASYLSRPEIARALRGRGSQDTRDSRTLKEKILATTVPIVDGRRRTGAVRITQSVAAVDRSVRRSVLGFAGVGLLVLAMGLAVGVLIARRIALPLRRLEGTAELVAAGDLESRARIEGSREQRSLARSFNVMTERLGRALQAQRSFVADASHQLRTPLTGLRLRIEEARAETREPAVREELDQGLAEVDRLTAMVEELLTLSRAGAREAPAETIDLADAVREAVRRWRPLAEDRDIELTAHANGASGSVTCARTALERSVDVLVENALRYSPQGSAVEVSSGAGRVEVLDRGPGLSPGEEKEVFERFHRGSAGRRGPAGSGLGLPIARELAREWGAEVRIENREGGGARATLAWRDE